VSVEDVQARLEKNWILKRVPWCAEGFTIEYRHGKRFDIGNIPEHQLGYFYVQESASMIPPVVLDPQPGELVLDLCAAPGSKTTQIAQYMQNTGIIIANDVQIDRLKPLGLNLQRCGVINTITTIRSNRKLAGIGPFDRVLVDAPCTGTGTVRRSLKTLLMWSPGLVRKLSNDQRQLIQTGFDLLKPGGVLVYSTCTQEPEENEGVVSWLLSKNENAVIDEISLDIKRSPAILSWGGADYDPRVAKCLRIYPQDNDSEGFFVARLRKIEASR